MSQGFFLIIFGWCLLYSGVFIQGGAGDDKFIQLFQKLPLNKLMFIMQMTASGIYVFMPFGVVLWLLGR